MMIIMLTVNGLMLPGVTLVMIPGAELMCRCQLGVIIYMNRIIIW